MQLHRVFSTGLIDAFQLFHLFVESFFNSFQPLTRDFYQAEWISSADAGNIHVVEYPDRCKPYSGSRSIHALGTPRRSTISSALIKYALFLASTGLHVRRDETHHK